MSAILSLAREGRPLNDCNILDMHGHLGRFFGAATALSPQSIVRVMDRLGVQSIMITHIQCEGGHASYGNDQVLLAMRAHPGRIRGYVIHFPHSREEVTAEMERCMAAGFSGLKLEDFNGALYTNPIYSGAFGIANERRLPVLLHTWGAKPQLEAAATLARLYPEASFLLAHAGVSEEEAYIRLAREHENIYLDTALSRGRRGLLEQLAGGGGADKVVYGSDCYYYSMTQQIGKVIGADLSEDDKLKILGGNARRIMGRIRS